MKLPIADCRLPVAKLAAGGGFTGGGHNCCEVVGFLQQSGAALCGLLVGQLLGQTAWPMAITIALTGVASLMLWATTQRVRKQALR